MRICQEEDFSPRHRAHGRACARGYIRGREA
nr:MAG TPA_asm: hypothetical protein [Caudoviricetes sp.]